MEPVSPDPASCSSRPTAEWLADYNRKIDNLRAALTWPFSPEGDHSLGTHLAASTAQLWLELSLLERTKQLWLMPEALLTIGETWLLGKGSAEARAADASCVPENLLLFMGSHGSCVQHQPRSPPARSGRFVAARDTLQPVYHRFTEWFETADLKAAKSVLEGLHADGIVPLYSERMH